MVDVYTCGLQHFSRCALLRRLLLVAVASWKLQLLPPNYYHFTAVLVEDHCSTLQFVVNCPWRSGEFGGFGGGWIEVSGGWSDCEARYCVDEIGLEC